MSTLTVPFPRRSAAVLLVGVLALAAAATSLGNGFSYDDIHIILNNPAVHSLSHAGHRLLERYWPPEVGVGLYRPLTILAYALQWAAGAGEPFVFHLTSVVLYALVAMLFLVLARRFLPPAAALAAAALWAVHPVHVEAVANVVGQSEIVAAIWLFAAALVYVRGREHGALGPVAEAAILVLYIFASLTKEHGLILPALLLALEFTVLESRPYAPGLRRFYLLLAACGLACFAVRTAVLGDLAGDLPPYWMVGISTAQRWLTMLAVAPQWIRLLLWPAHLQADYGPRELEVATGFGATQVVGLLLLIAIALLAWTIRRRQPVITLGILWAAIALLPVSNLLLPTGIALAERTLFLPSAGICLALGAVLDGLASQYEWKRLRVIVAVLVAAGLGWSAFRQPVWKDNMTLFHQTTIDAPLSYRAHWGYGSMLFDQGEREQGFREMEIARSLFPRDTGLLLEMARRLRNAGACQAAIPLYREAMAVTTSDDLRWGTRTVLILCLLDLHDFAAAKAEAVEGQKQLIMASQFRHLAQYADSLAAVPPARP